MVPSSALAISSDDEHLMCSGFSLGEIIQLGSFEFIVDYFGDLPLSQEEQLRHRHHGLNL
jgi:hypothetical protein